MERGKIIANYAGSQKIVYFLVFLNLVCRPTARGVFKNTALIYRKFVIFPSNFQFFLLIEKNISEEK